jgi:hypothetical protein
MIPLFYCTIFYKIEEQNFSQIISGFTTDKSLSKK